MTQPPTVGDAIAERVRLYRLKRDWSVRRLAEECAKHGAPQLTAASLGNIERGVDPSAKRKRRDVTVDELMVLAYVLDVPPAMLMLPLGDSTTVEVCPGVEVESYTALQWMAGKEWLSAGRTLENTHPPLRFYDDAAERIRLFEEIEAARKDAAHIHGVLHGDPEPILRDRRRSVELWEKHPEFRPFYEHTVKVRNEPPPWQPISDEEYVEEFRKRVVTTYEKWLRDYAASLWRAVDAGVRSLPRVPRPLYDDLVALQSKPEPLPDEIDPLAGGLRKRAVPSRPLLPPGVEIAEERTEIDEDAFLLAIERTKDFDGER